MSPTRVLHVTDLHAGTREEPGLADALYELVQTARPELVIVTGDLTHRNTRAQHARAAALLRSLDCPSLVVPGNHDIPCLPPIRFTRTFREFLLEWPQTEPVYRSERLVVCGLNSVRPWKYQGGSLRGEQLRRATGVLEQGPPEALRVVALHHHLLGAPWRSHKWAVARRTHVLTALVESRAELILAGHVHQSVVCERREFEGASGDLRGTVVVTGPGLGQPRPRRRGEARGLHLFEADERSLRVLTYAWTGTWCLIAERRFPRGLTPLVPTSSVASAQSVAARR